MNAKSKMMLKALLHTAHPNASKALYRYLSPEDEEALNALPPPHVSEVAPMLAHTTWLAGIHYSWFTSTLATLPKETQGYVLSLLTQEQQQGFTSQTPRSCSPFLSFYLSYHLKQQMQPETTLPLAHLLPSELIGLLDLTKAELVHLIDLLGIYDLAAELRHIVDNALLEKIYVALSQEQLHFLHYCRKAPMKWVPPKLNIARWDGKKTSLSHLLHKRGLVRLAKALQDEDVSFIWHVCHRLDIGRGDIIMKSMEGPAMASSFKGEVKHIMKRFSS